MFNLRWVPLPVLQKALTEKVHREIALFLYLKMTTSSRLKIEGKKKCEIMQVLKVSESTLYRYVETLRMWDWVGFDKTTSVYYIRGFKRIYEIEKFVSKTAVQLTVSDLFNLQIFSFSASLGYLLRLQRRWKRRQGAGRQPRRSYQSPASIYKPVALSVMESFFQLSKDTIVKLKKHAIIMGYIDRKRGYTELYDVADHSPVYYESFPEHWGRLRKVLTETGWAIVLIEADRFIDMHKYRSRNYK